MKKILPILGIVFIVWLLYSVSSDGPKPAEDPVDQVAGLNPDLGDTQGGVPAMINTTTPTTAVTPRVYGRDIYAADDIIFEGELMPDGSTCSNGQILKKTGADDWDCATDSTGGGGGGSGTVTTSTPETANYVPFWTSTAGTPATLGSDSGLQYDSTNDRLTVTTASTTSNLTVGGFASSTGAIFTQQYFQGAQFSDPAKFFYLSASSTDFNIMRFVGATQAVELQMDPADVPNPYFRVARTDTSRSFVDVLWEIANTGGVDQVVNDDGSSYNVWVRNGVDGVQETAPRIRLRTDQVGAGASGGIVLGNGTGSGDANLYWSAADILKTDDSLTIAQKATSTVSLAVGAGTGDFINFTGGDLYVQGDAEFDSILYMGGSDIFLKGSGSDILSDTDIDLYPTNQTTRSFRITDDTVDIDLSATGGAGFDINDNVNITGVTTSTLAFWAGTAGTANNIDLTGGDLYVQNDAEVDGTIYSTNERVSGSATTTVRLVLGATQPTNNFGKLWIGGDDYTSGNSTTTLSLTVGSLTAASCDVKADTNGLLSCGTDATGAVGSPGAWEAIKVNLLHPTNTSSGIMVGGSSAWTSNPTIGAFATSTDASSTLFYASSTPTFSGKFLQFREGLLGGVVFQVDKAGNTTTTNKFYAGDNIVSANGEYLMSKLTTGEEVPLLGANGSNDIHFLADVISASVGNVFFGFNSPQDFSFGGSCCGGNLPTAFNFDTSGAHTFKINSTAKMAVTSGGDVTISGGLAIDADGTFPDPGDGSILIGDGSDTGNVELEDGSMCIGDGGCTPSTADGGLNMVRSTTTDSVYMSGLPTDATTGLTGSICLDANNQLKKMTGAGTCVTSLRQFKDSIEDLSHGLDWVMKAHPRTFVYNFGDNMPSLGFIADEVAKIDPRLVSYDTNTGELTGVRYELWSAVLAKAVQEQQGEIETLQAQVNGGAPIIQNFNYWNLLGLLGLIGFLPIIKKRKSL